jgi:hypothetical protein
MFSEACGPVSAGTDCGGEVIAASGRENALSPGAEHHLAAFTELIATAIARPRRRRS